MEDTMPCRSSIVTNLVPGFGWGGRCESEFGHEGFHRLEYQALGDEKNDTLLYWRGDLAILSPGSLTEVIFAGSSSLTWPEYCIPGSQGGNQMTFNPASRHDWIPLEKMSGFRSPLASFMGLPMYWYCRHCRRIDEITMGNHEGFTKR